MPQTKTITPKAHGITDTARRILVVAFTGEKKSKSNPLGRETIRMMERPHPMKEGMDTSEVAFLYPDECRKIAALLGLALRGLMPLTALITDDDIRMVRLEQAYREENCYALLKISTRTKSVKAPFPDWRLESMVTIRSKEVSLTIRALEDQANYTDTSLGNPLPMKPSVR